MGVIALPAITTAEATTAPVARAPRVAAIDWMRGAVMILMALDHVRTFFSDHGFPPEDMQHTSMALFLTRWVTHFCAPLFFLLAGSSAYLSGTARGLRSLPAHLVKRGLWLIALELTVIGFAWSFVPGDSFAGVIWCLGWSMIALAGLVRLPLPAIAWIAGVTIAGHDLLDDVSGGALWHFLHIAGPVSLRGIGTYFVLFPLIPWFAVMALGYAIGPWFMRDVRERKSLFYISGSLATILFIILRLTNAYGNPAWAFQRGGAGHFRTFGSPALTCIAFLNTEKYPPSLQFLLMTLGPSLIVLAALDGLLQRRDFLRPVTTFGRVPFLYYVLHLYVIHALAIGVAGITGRKGWPLNVVWTIWLATVALLYVPCRWFESLKARRGDWWLRYI